MHPCDTAQNSVAKLAEKIGLQSIEGWALYESGPTREAHIPGHHYLYDVISSWEIEQLADKTTVKNSPAKVYLFIYLSTNLSIYYLSVY